MIRTGSLFSQILSLFQRSTFAHHVRELKAEYHARGFSSWDQFVAMLFCQLAQARSLREIADGLKSCEGKLKHLGLEQEPKRSTLSYANAHRPRELFQRLFYDLLAQCQALSPRKKFRFKNRLLTLDSTTVELCASMFDWAHWRQTKGAVKLHLLLDHEGYLPVFGHVTDGKTGDVKVAQKLDFPRGSIVVLDRGYTDYFLFTRWTRQGVFFVTRLAVLVLRYLQFRSRFHWALSNLVALLRWSLFTYRNLWEWLDRPFDTPPLSPDQLELKLDSIGALS